MGNQDDYQRLVWNDKRHQEFMNRAFRPPPPSPHDEQGLNKFIDWLLEPPRLRLFAYKTPNQTAETMEQFVQQLVRPSSIRVFLGKLKELSPMEFQDLVANLLVHLGGQVVPGKRGADGAIDVTWQTSRGEYIVQCKKWQRLPVGVPVIREIIGALSSNSVRGAFIVTTSRFSSDAVGLVENFKLRVGLIDGNELFNLLSIVMPSLVETIQSGGGAKT